MTRAGWGLTLWRWPASMRGTRPQGLGRWRCWLASGLLLAVPVAAAQQTVGEFDREHTRFGVELRTRWGQRVMGEFPRYDGELVMVDERRRQVRVRLDTASFVVAGSDRYTQMARGEAFFDAGQHPQVEFVSDPVGEDEVRRGGALRGRLTIRDVSRIETFELQPATCARPGRDCDVVASGRIDRHDYGLSAWRFALDNHVRFTLQVRLDKDAQP